MISEVHISCYLDVVFLNAFDEKQILKVKKENVKAKSVTARGSVEQKYCNSWHLIIFIQSAAMMRITFLFFF